MATKITLKQLGQDILDYIKKNSGEGGEAYLERDVRSNVTVGAAPANTLFPEGQSFTEFVEMIAKKDLNPTITTSFSGAGLKEVGTTVNGSTMTLNITNENLTTATINEIKFYDGAGVVLSTQPYVKGTTSYSYTYNKPITTNTTLKAELVYNGSAKVSGTGKFEFVYASYYGPTALSSISDADATSLANTFTKSIKNTPALRWDNITLNDERFCYMYPVSLGTLASIKDGNGFSQIDGYVKTQVNLTSPADGKVVAYYVYLLKDATTGSGFTQIYE